MSKALTPINPPKPGDYGPSAIRGAVLDAGLKHPATIYPIALGAGAGVVGFLFGIQSLYFAAAAGIAGGPLWAAIQILLLGGRNGRQYIKGLNGHQEEYERYLIDMIEENLEECRRVKGTKDQARLGIEQLKRIREKFDNVRELLEIKLKGEELTYGRFFGAAKQVSLSVMDNLKNTAGLLKSAGSIRPEYILERLDKLAGSVRQTDAEAKQEKALEESLELYKTQLSKVDSLLTKNEEAMTELEKISAAIAEWQTDGRFSDTDFEFALTRLQELAERAHEYNI